MKKLLILLVILLIALTGCQRVVGRGEVPSRRSDPNSMRATVPTSKADALDFVDMIDRNNGWGVKENTVYRLREGGKEWDEVLTMEQRAESSDVNGCGTYFADEKEAWIAWLVSHGDRATVVRVYHTRDSGRSWNTVSLPTKEPWEGEGIFVSFVDRQIGYILLTSSPAAGQMNKALYRTKNGGNSWVRIGDITSMVESYPTGIAFRDQAVGWITSSYHGQEYMLVFKTTDGGKKWDRMSLPYPHEFQERAYANAYPPVFFKGDRNKGLLPIEFVGDRKRAVVFYLTADGGKTWVPSAPVDNIYLYQQVYSFPTPQSGFLLDHNGTIYRIGDGGKTWNIVCKSADLKGRTLIMDFVDEKTGYVLRDGVLFATMDGGKTWENVNMHH
ncbi:MAG TPA: hypothetical protein GXX50_05535 [Firmicutes bacterium]|nr:hypothetical protein [Bacillota bacterium]